MPAGYMIDMEMDMDTVDRGHKKNRSLVMRHAILMPPGISACSFL